MKVFNLLRVCVCLFVKIGCSNLFNNETMYEYKKGKGKHLR